MRTESVNLQLGGALPNVKLQIKDFANVLVLPLLRIKQATDCQHLPACLSISNQAKRALLPPKPDLLQVFDVLRVEGVKQKCLFDRQLLWALATHKHELLLLWHPDNSLTRKKQLSLQLREVSAVSVVCGVAVYFDQGLV